MPKGVTWIRPVAVGTAVFTMPAGPIRCAGAPREIAYLAADCWREQGVLDRMDIHPVLPTPGMFGVKGVRRPGARCPLRRVRLVPADHGTARHGTPRHAMPLAECDYSMTPEPSIPVIDTITGRCGVA